MPLRFTPQRKPVYREWQDVFIFPKIRSHDGHYQTTMQGEMVSTRKSGEKVGGNDLGAFSAGR